MLTHGGKLPEIAKILTESTGHNFEHQDVYRVIQKLQKRFQEAGEERPEFRVLEQVPSKQGLQLQDEWPAPPSSITLGLLFPDYNSMRASLEEWSRVNFSPLAKVRSERVRSGHPRPSHTFGCPHSRKARRILGGSGIRRQRKKRVEYVDCPFRIDIKVNADGSCVVTRALTEHKGHEVSEEQFLKYYSR